MGEVYRVCVAVACVGCGVVFKCVWSFLGLVVFMGFRVCEIWA